jgi:hypothetical protein
VATLTLTRACERVGVDPDQMTPADLSRALASIRAALRVYLPFDEVERRMAMIAALAK